LGALFNIRSDFPYRKINHHERVVERLTAVYLQIIVFLQALKIHIPFFKYSPMEGMKDVNFSPAR